MSLTVLHTLRAQQLHKHSYSTCMSVLRLMGMSVPSLHNLLTLGKLMCQYDHLLVVLELLLSQRQS